MYNWTSLQGMKTAAYILNINHTNLRRREVDAEGLLPVWHQLKVRYKQKESCLGLGFLEQSLMITIAKKVLLLLSINIASPHLLNCIHMFPIWATPPVPSSLIGQIRYTITLSPVTCSLMAACSWPQPVLSSTCWQLYFRSGAFIPGGNCQGRSRWCWGWGY